MLQWYKKETELVGARRNVCYLTTMGISSAVPDFVPGPERWWTGIMSSLLAAALIWYAFATILIWLPRCRSQDRATSDDT